MTELFSWITTNYQEILFALTSIVTAASIIVKLTPTLRDDNVWLPIVKWISKYIAINRTTNDAEVRAQQ